MELEPNYDSRRHLTKWLIAATTALAIETPFTLWLVLKVWFS